MGADGIWLRARPVPPNRLPVDRAPVDRLPVDRMPVDRAPGPALFLDRDGTIIEEVGYLHRPGDVRLIEGAAAVIAAANARAIPVIVVTNQAGIGRGLFDWPDLIAVEEHLEAELEARGARLDAVLASPFHPEGRAPYAHPSHPGRKPNPGLLLRAAAVFAIDLERSWIIGDRASDIAAGRAAGLAGGIHVATGWGRAPNECESALACAVEGRYRVLVADGIADAALALPFFTGPTETAAGT